MLARLHLHNHPLLLYGALRLAHRWSINTVHTKDDDMYKIFIAGITAISLTFSTAAPAQANGFSEEDIGKFVFGLIAAAVAANLIKNNQNHEEPAPVAAPRPLNC